MLNNHDTFRFPDDFEKKINRNILLTGAGFSSDFGFPLAAEVANVIYNAPNISKEIQSEIISNQSNYEATFESLSVSDRETIKKTILNIFKEYDNPKAYWDKFITNYEKFFRIFKIQDRYNFIITLNQDILLERILINYEAYSNNIKLNIPYTSYSFENVIQSKDTNAVQYQKNYRFQDFAQEIDLSETNTPTLGFINYLKLHGSSNWNNNSGNLIITGTSKPDQIKNNPMLYKISLFFNALLKLTDLNIVIVGYQFRDAHVNESILNAIDNGGKLYVVNSNSLKKFCYTDFLFDSDSVNKKKRLITGIDKYFSTKMCEFIKSNDFKILSDKLTNHQY